MSLGFSLSPVALPVSLSSHRSFAFANRIFAVAGLSATSTPNQNIYSAIVDQGGTLQPFAITATLPSFFSGFEYPGFAQEPSPRSLIYLVGGYNRTLNVSVTDVVIGRPNSDGSIIWTAGTTLPRPLENLQCAIVGSWLYACGGNDTIAPVAAIAAIAGDIALANGPGTYDVTLTLTVGAAFSPVPNPGDQIILPAGSVLQAAHAANGGVYLVHTASSTVITATKVANLVVGALTTPVATAATPIVATTDVENSGQPASSSNIWAAKIQSDGSLGAWIPATPCPISAGTGQFPVAQVAMGTKKYLYMGGGYIYLPSTGSGDPVASGQYMYRGVPDQGDGQYIQWDVEQVGLGASRSFAAVPALGIGRLIAVGGTTGGTAATTAALSANALASVDEFILDSDGSIASVQPESVLPVAIWRPSVVAVNRWVFVIGGTNASATRLSSVYQASIQNDRSF
jgi:hypothetical protein